MIISPPGQSLAGRFAPSSGRHLLADEHAGVHDGQLGRTRWPSRRLSNCRPSPGRREELRRALESLIATSGPGQDGFLGSTRYGVIDDPDVLVEIADWESAEAREAHMKEAAATGAYAPLVELLAAPFRAMVIGQLP